MHKKVPHPNEIQNTFVNKITLTACACDGASVQILNHICGLVNRQRMSKQIIAKTNVDGIHDLETI